MQIYTHDWVPTLLGCKQCAACTHAVYWNAFSIARSGVLVHKMTQNEHLPWCPSKDVLSLLHQASARIKTDLRLLLISSVDLTCMSDWLALPFNSKLKLGIKLYQCIKLCFFILSFLLYILSKMLTENINLHTKKERKKEKKEQVFSK